MLTYSYQTKQMISKICNVILILTLSDEATGKSSVSALTF